MKVKDKKQLILSSVAGILIITGYFNFQNVEKNNNLAKINEENIGDVQLVNSEALIMENKIENIIQTNSNTIINEVKKDEDKKIDKEKENNKEMENNTNDYFVKTRLERDEMYSRMLESYSSIVNNNQISSEQKAIAIQEISNINNYKNGIMISENLIKNKGFEDVVILINNKTVSVIVKKEMLFDTDIVKIKNIIETKLGFNAENISISNM